MSSSVPDLRLISSTTIRLAEPLYLLSQEALSKSLSSRQRRVASHTVWRNAAWTSWVAQPLAGAWHKISVMWREPGEEPEKGSKHSYRSVQVN